MQEFQFQINEILKHFQRSIPQTPLTLAVSPLPGTTVYRLTSKVFIITIY